MHATPGRILAAQPYLPDLPDYDFVREKEPEFLRFDRRDDALGSCGGTQAVSRRLDRQILAGKLKS